MSEGESGSIRTAVMTVGLTGTAISIIGSGFGIGNLLLANREWGKQNPVLLTAFICVVGWVLAFAVGAFVYLVSENARLRREAGISTFDPENPGNLNKSEDD